MRVVVTGANGYIGRHVVSKLLEKDEIEVVANDIITDGMDSRAIANSSDIFSEANLYEEFGKPDICIHLAWQDGFVHNADSHMLNLSNHYSFIKGLIDSGLKHVVVMGTMHEVGYYEGVIDENTPCKPLSKYGIAKNSLRQSLELLTKENGVVFQWLRGFYIVGDNERGNSIFSKMVKANNEGKDEFPFTTGKNKYDFTDVDMLAEQIATAATQDEIVGIINCCSGNPISLADKAEEFIKQQGLSIKLKYGVYPEREYDSSAIWGDNTKISAIMKRRIMK